MSSISTRKLSYFIHIRDVNGRVTRLDYFFKGDRPPQLLPHD